jgi:hypothetical protein
MQVMAVLLAGCAPSSSWESTQAVCDFPMSQVDASSFVTPPAYPSASCVDAVVADFGFDMDSEPYALLDGEPDADSALGRLLWAAHALLTADLGPLDALQGAWATPSFREALAGPSLAPVNARLYDYVTSRVDMTLSADHADAAAGLQGDTLLLYDLPAGIDGAAVLVHEARHRDGFDHVPCGGEAICDADLAGSWGFELAVHELARDHSVDELAREIEQSWLDAIPARIVAE